VQALELSQASPHAVPMISTTDASAISPEVPTEAETAALIDFTAAAAAKVRELIREEGNEALKLRVYIQGGGCSGFQYGFEFDEQQNEDDLAVRTEDVTLLVDPLSLQYLVGAQVDYTESLHGAQFVIRNPNAKTTCGCGSSFSA
jgi:iron-sulfur cluster insertion protein